MEFGLVYRFGGDSQPARPPDDIGPPSKDGKEPLVSAEREGETETKDPPPQEEDDEELDLKLTILEVYNERYDRRVESKALIFDRALTDYKKVRLLYTFCFWLSMSRLRSTRRSEGEMSESW